MRFLILLLSFTFLFIGNSFSKECNSQKKTEFKFQRGYFYLASEPAGFDPCHPSVDFNTGSDFSQKKPLVIGVHGGGGKGAIPANSRKQEKSSGSCPGHSAGGFRKVFKILSKIAPRSPGEYFLIRC